jgi:hypothetical protein
MSLQKLVFLLAACGIGSSALAQRTAIAPLVPVMPVVVLPNQSGVNVATKSPTQPAAPTADQPSRKVPFYLIDSRILVGASLAKVNPQGIAKVDVYREANVPAKWRGLATNGLIAITLKPHLLLRIKTKSLASISHELKISGPVAYQLEDLPLEDLTLRIATADIARLDTQPTPSGIVINIHLARIKSAAYPPGTIMIRGVSSL